MLTELVVQGQGGVVPPALREHASCVPLRAGKQWLFCLCSVHIISVEGQQLGNWRIIWEGHWNLCPGLGSFSSLSGSSSQWTWSTSLADWEAGSSQLAGFELWRGLARALQFLFAGMWKSEKATWRSSMQTQSDRGCVWGMRPGLTPLESATLFSVF